MKRTEFVKQLREFLREVEQEEKEEALQYYEDYLEEASILEDMEVPESFGTPQQVAQIVRNGLSGKFEEEAEFTERGFQGFTETKHPVDSFGGIVKSENQAYQEKEKTGWEKEKKKGLIVILLILAAKMMGVPILLSVLIVVASLISCGITTVGLGILALFMTGVGMLVMGIFLCGIGVLKLLAVPFAGLVLIGGGLISLSFGLLSVMAGVQLTGKILPKVVKKTSEVCRRIFQRMRKERSV